MIPPLSKADLGVIARIPLFSDLAEEDIAALLDGAGIRDFTAPGMLFWSGDEADRFYLVLEGRVRLSVLTEAGTETVIEIIGAGNSFAEAAIFASARFPLNAQAEGGSRLAEIPASPFLKRLRDTPRLAQAMLAALTRWQGRLLREVEILKSQPPDRRLAAYLLSLASPQAGDGRIEITLPLTKALLASRLGIQPESLSRALLRLTEIGVENQGRNIVVNDLARLRTYCGQS